MFVAAYVLSRPRVWLYQPVWFSFSNKQCGIARVCCSGDLLLCPSAIETLVYVSIVSPILILQCEIVHTETTLGRCNWNLQSTALGKEATAL